MLLTVAAVLIILWALGLLAHVGGLINILIVVALVVVIVHFMRGGRSTTV